MIHYKACLEKYNWSVDIYVIQYKHDLEYLDRIASKYNLPNIFTNYKNDVYFQITYSGDDDTIYKILVFNKETNTEITDFSEENLKKLLDIGYDKPINNATYIRFIYV